MPHARVAGEALEGVEHVARAHAPQPLEQRARVLQHDPRLEALGEQLGNELAHPLVAPPERGRVVVVADVGVLQHPLQVADDRRAAQLGPAGWDQRLVHVQSDGERAVDLGQAHRGLAEERGPVAAGGDRRLKSVAPNRTGSAGRLRTREARS